MWWDRIENVLRLKIIEIFGYYLSLKVNIVYKCINNENKDYLIIEFIIVFERYWLIFGKIGIEICIIMDMNILKKCILIISYLDLKLE